MNATKILGTGSYVPDNIVHNKTFEKMVETSDEWIQTRTGIKSRHITLEENTSDLAYEAAKKAMASAKTNASEIDLIIVATVTGDYFFPGVAQLLQRRLKCRNIPAFDINAACTGFVYALEIADKMMKNDGYKKALIIGAETLSKFTDFEDRNTCVLFADAAGAMILGRSEQPGIEDVILHSEGDLEGLLRMESYPLKKDFKTIENKRPFISMNGRDVFRFATTVLPSVIRELLEKTHSTIEDLDLIIAHQANKRIIDKAARSLEFPRERMYLNIESFGNTSAASVPLAIDEAIKSGRLKKGMRFACAAFGAGLTWGGAIIQY